ncbi:YeeE/YedE family protein [Pseudotabrizicola sp. 4114]|uniref:YeeE/YedE family protein n=1 Tax=Pseudotabrizicola sp. 4114 TaxID=2817731 RepID=UPI0028578C40|nr:putative membrane protein YedE/YeeE [Pseudorhodobacter sp. 4114]
MTLSRLFPALLALAIFAAFVFYLPARDALGRPLPLSMLLGGVFGIVLQRSRFCFWCISADWFRNRDPRGFLGILAALAVGSIGYTLILGAWLPDPFSGRLPPDAHVGPVSVALVLGAFAFGLGMALSGSCISAHIYRLGEGAFGSIVALIGALAGFMVGFLSWNSLYLWQGYAARPLWLPGWLGHGGALAVQLAVLAGLAGYLIWRYVPRSPETVLPFTAIFQRRWPAWVGGLLVGFIATLAYVRVGPLGVTAELGSVARTAASGAGLLPETLYGLDGLAGCATVIKETVPSRNGVFVLGILFGSFASARVAGDWQPALPKPTELPRLFLGGVLLGWGAMVALGCTVGVILSGIMVGAVSGWVFTAFCLLGAWIGWHLRQRMTW